jgi:hypothetical protein
MMMKKHIQQILFIVMAMVTIGLCQLFPNAATTPESGLVLWLPNDIEGHTSEERELSDAEKKILPPDTTKVSRSYLEKSLPDDISRYRALSATLILAGADKRSLHKPEICLVGQGWTIAKSEPVKLETVGGELEVMHLHLTRQIQAGGEEPAFQRAHYVYWWVARDKSTPFSNKRLLISAYNNIFKNLNDRWGYPSVMVLADERYGEAGNKESIERAYAFIKQHAPSFQKSLGAVDRPDAKKPVQLGNPEDWEK